MATITLQPNAAAGVDVYIRNGIYAGNNFGVANLLIGETNADTTTARVLIKFDLSSLPSDATIISATLSLYATSDLSDNARTFRVYRQKRAWVEGTQDNAVNTTGASWNEYSPGNSWQTAGGFGANDCEQTDIGSRAFTATETLSQFKDFTLTPTTKSALDLGNGWLVKADTEANDAYGFPSSDNATAANRPKLVIVYKVLSPVAGTSPGTSSTSGTLKGKAGVGSSISAVATVAGTLFASVQAVGSSDGLAVVTGTLSATGNLAGTATGTAQVDGSIMSVVLLAGSAAGIATDVATLTSIDHLRGAVAGTSVESGLLKATGYLQGSAEGTATATARSVGDVSLSGSSLAIATESAILTARGYADGSSATIATVVGVIVALGRLAGNSSGVSSSTASLDDGIVPSGLEESTYIHMFTGHFRKMR